MGAVWTNRFRTKGDVVAADIRPVSPVPSVAPTVISGGQTGVDRAALDVALMLGLPHGGWCPAGRRAEDGTIPTKYGLTPTASPRYITRTRLNVRDSDATLVLHAGVRGRGTDATIALARRHARPWLEVDLSEFASKSAHRLGPHADRANSLGGFGPRGSTQAIDPRVAEVLAWLASHRVARLNVAGPRESTAPGIGERAAKFLRELLPAWRDTAPGSTHSAAT